MSRKKHKTEKPNSEQKMPSQKTNRAKGKRRAELVLEIVETDSTFDLIDPKGAGHPHWVGRCIHCNTKLYVTDLGGTDATIEHINPLCNDGAARDPQNLALACARCNNEKGVRHDQHAGKGRRADEVIAALLEKRLSRCRART